MARFSLRSRAVMAATVSGTQISRVTSARYDSSKKGNVFGTTGVVPRRDIHRVRLEGRSYGEAEGFTWLAQEVLRLVEGERIGVCVVAG